jgi:hypothetical protein
VTHASPSSRRVVVTPTRGDGIGTLVRLVFSPSRPPLSARTTGAAAHGENKAKMCDELFKAYKACRKAEHAEIVRRRRASKKGMFWD